MQRRWPALAEHLEKIPYFVAIAQAGSFQGAAKELRLSQPSLTKSMQLLEGAVGASLFRRSRRGVSLTPAGDEFRRFCEPFLASLTTVEHAVRTADGDDASGELRVGTHEILVREFWPRLVRAVRDKSPKLRLTLFTTPSVGDMVRRLSAAELDVIVAVECTAHKSLDRREIRADHYGFYVSRGFARERGLSKGAKLDLVGLTQMPLIYAAQVIAGPGVLLAEALRAAGIDQPSLHDVRSLESVLSLVAADLGIGILPTRMAETAGNLVPVAVTGLARTKLGEHRLYATSLVSAAGDRRIKDLVKQVASLLGD
jgi:DNA-binding transcriptional LysR family regulator